MAARLIVRKARLEDTDGLRALVKDAAQDGAIRISYEREPDYFTATRIPAPDSQVWVLEDTKSGMVAGAFCVGQRDCFVNGNLQPVWYGNELRIHSAYRGGVALHRMFRQLRDALGANWMQTIIMGDNKTSLGAVASGRAGLPTYYECGETLSCLLSVKQKMTAPSGFEIRRASRDDLPAMQALYNTEASAKQLAPAYQFSQFGSDASFYHGIRLENVFLAFAGDQLTGMATLWDQTPFKQSRIVKYAAPLRIARPLINLAASMTGDVRLPPEGAVSRYAYLHNAVTRQNAPEPFRALLAELLSLGRTGKLGAIDALVTGFDPRDPLLDALAGLKLRKMPAQQFLASYTGDPRPALNSGQLFYVEPSRM